MTDNLLVLTRWLPASATKRQRMRAVTHSGLVWTMPDLCNTEANHLMVARTVANRQWFVWTAIHHCQTRQGWAFMFVRQKEVGDVAHL